MREEEEDMVVAESADSQCCSLMSVEEGALSGS
jgi:hypothetical protein